MPRITSIHGYKDKYLILDTGIVLRKDGSEVAQCTRGKGYKFVRLNNNGQRKSFSVHRLVAQAFIGNPKNKPLVNHRDGNKINNNFSNLEWVTDSENKKHASINGLQKTKINETTANKIRQLYKEGNNTQLQIAKSHNIHQSQVSRIINNKRW